MGARDRPFPPGGLPTAESKIFRMACDLAYRTEYLQEKEIGGGTGSQTAVRKIGAFHIEVEFHIAPKTLIRYTAMIWYEDHLVFNAWCSRTSEGEMVGLVVTCEDGPWKAHLRRRSEAEEKS